MTADAFTLADRDLCDTIAREYGSANLNESERAWTALGKKIERVLNGEYARFERRDQDIVIAMQRALHLSQSLPNSNAQSRARELAHLGLIVHMAVRGLLPQLRVHT